MQRRSHLQGGGGVRALCQQPRHLLRRDGGRGREAQRGQLERRRIDRVLERADRAVLDV